jgi:hypothetical protein
MFMKGWTKVQGRKKLKDEGFKAERGNDLRWSHPDGSTAQLMSRVAPERGVDIRYKAPQCPHGEPINSCDDCRREHSQATA